MLTDFKNSFTADSASNFQQNDCYISHRTLSVSVNISQSYAWE